MTAQNVEGRKIATIIRPRHQVRCVDCERKRDPFAPIYQDTSGHIFWCCRQCWTLLYFWETHDSITGQITISCYLPETHKMLVSARQE